MPTPFTSSFLSTKCVTPLRLISVHTTTDFTVAGYLKVKVNMTINLSSLLLLDQKLICDIKKDIHIIDTNILLTRNRIYFFSRQNEIINNIIFMVCTTR